MIPDNSWRYGRHLITARNSGVNSWDCLGPMALKPSAIHFIADNFPKGMKILELGSGTGTESLLDKGFSVFSIEQDPEWAFKYHEGYILAPLKFNEIDNRWWFDPIYLKGKIPTGYDFLLIDGPSGPKGCRLGILENLELFNMNVPILVDDVNRPEDLELFNILSEGRESSLHGSFGVIQ